MDRLSGARFEEALAASVLARQDEVGRSARRLVVERTHRGTGGIRDWFPDTLSAWLLRHPEDAQLDELAARFCRSPHHSAWRELDAVAPGISLEEALFRFFEDEDIGDAATREEELASTIVRTLAVTPRARFVWPSIVRRAPGGCVCITRSLVMHAAVEGRYLRGTITPLVAAVLRGEAINALVHAELSRLGLV
jgi:hypothetical protein